MKRVGCTLSPSCEAKQLCPSWRGCGSPAAFLRPHDPPAPGGGKASAKLEGKAKKHTHSGVRAQKNQSSSFQGVIRTNKPPALHRKGRETTLAVVITWLKIEVLDQNLHPRKKNMCTVLQRSIPSPSIARGWKHDGRLYGHVAFNSPYYTLPALLSLLTAFSVSAVIGRTKNINILSILRLRALPTHVVFLA